VCILYFGANFANEKFAGGGGETRTRKPETGTGFQDRLLTIRNTPPAVGAGFEPAGDFLDPHGLATRCFGPLSQPTIVKF
jgi:hypothetical protein